MRREENFRFIKSGITGDIESGVKCKEHLFGVFNRALGILVGILTSTLQYGANNLRNCAETA